MNPAHGTVDEHRAADATESGDARTARSPKDLDRSAWRAVGKRVVARAKVERLTLLAAGVAFFALFALVPSLASVVAIYGLVADPDEVRAQVDDFGANLPEETRDLLVAQLERVIDLGAAGLGFTLAGSLAVALWSASSGMRHLIDAVHVAYDESDERGFVRTRGEALGFTLGAAVLAVLAISAMTVLPPLAARWFEPGIASLVNWARWPILALAMLGALSVLYRSSPDRRSPRWRWVSVGSVFAVIAWLVGSAGFSLYMDHFGGQFSTYGQLGAALVTMLWLLLSTIVILVGAYLNAELEHQTTGDTTVGDDRPRGSRDAAMADRSPTQ